MRHKGFWGKSVTCFRLYINYCPQEHPPQTGEVKARRQGNEVKQIGREKAVRCISPRFADRKMTSKLLAAATIRCCWKPCLTDDSTLQDNILRLAQTSNKSYELLLFQPQPGWSFISGLIWLFESFSKTPRCTLAALRAGLYDKLNCKHDSNQNILYNSYFQGEAGQCCNSSFFSTRRQAIHWINPSEMCRRRAEKRGEINTWLGTNNLPPSKARRYHINGAFEKVEGKMLLRGSTARLKAAVLFFHFALTRRLQTTVNLSVFVLFSSQGLRSVVWRAAGSGIVSQQRAGGLYGTVEGRSLYTVPSLQAVCLSKITCVKLSLH